MRRLLTALAVSAVAVTAHAQKPSLAAAEKSPDKAKSGVMLDPARVDSAHYTVEYEDAGIRILRVRMPAGSRSVMHEHPKATCVVSLTAEHTRHWLDDSTSTETEHKPGEVTCSKDEPGWYRHNPENISGQDEEILLIERKTPGYGRGLQPARAKKTVP